jgi:hypothetical protein
MGKDHKFCSNLCDPKVGWKACNKFMIFSSLLSHSLAINFVIKLLFHCLAINFQHKEYKTLRKQDV